MANFVTRSLIGATVVVAFVALVATGAQASGDSTKGRALFVQCRICHTVAKGGSNGVGPNLFGVVGRKAGTLQSYSYSTAMKKYAAVWDAPTLANFLTGPSKIVPGTKMPFAGFANHQQAEDMAAYLATLK